MFSPIAYIVPEKEASELFFHSGCSPRDDAAGLSEEQAFDIKKYMMHQEDMFLFQSVQKPVIG